MIYAETAGNAGLVTTRRNRVTGLLVSVYQSAAAGIEDDPALPFATMCEEHGSVVCHETKTLAMLQVSDPEGWCEACRLLVYVRMIGLDVRSERYVVAYCQHADDVDVALALPFRCPDCDTRAPRGAPHVTDADGLVLIGCTGTWTIPVALVGLGDCERCGDLFDPNATGAGPGLCSGCAVVQHRQPGWNVEADGTLYHQPHYQVATAALGNNNDGRAI